MEQQRDYVEKLREVSSSPQSIKKLIGASKPAKEKAPKGVSTKSLLSKYM